MEKDVIKKQLKKIKFDDPERSNKIFSAVRPFSQDFFYLLESKVSPDKESQTKWQIEMVDHPFCIWLRNQENFREARNKLIKKGIIQFQINEQESIATVNNNIFSIEFICASFILECSDPAILETLVIPQRKINAIRRLAKKLLNTLLLTDGHIFEDEPKQHLVIFLLMDLLQSDNESVFNSGIKHPKLFREFFIKSIVRQMGYLFGCDFKPSFYADVAIDIAGIFFDGNMDRSDCIAKSKKVLIAVNEELNFRKKTVDELLREYHATREFLKMLSDLQRNHPPEKKEQVD